MKKLLVVLPVLTLMLVTAAVATQGAAVNGWVTDSRCGLKGTSAAHAACAKKCIAEGAKVAFVPDGTKDVLIVDNPDSLKDHIGQHVTIMGSTDRGKKTIHVDSVKMMAEAAR